jgi:hypothetical protein
MRASPTGFAIALLTTVVAAGMASAQSSYPCTETNANLPNPYRQVANWASPPRPWSPVNAVAVDPTNNLWAVDRCETDDCIPVIKGDRVRRAHLPIARAEGAEGPDEFAVLGKHHDARVVGLSLAMAFADVDVAIGGHSHAGRRVEDIEAALAGALAGPAELQEHAAIGTELRHLHAFHALRRGIGHPEIAILIDGRLVRLDEKTGAEIPKCLAVGAKFVPGARARRARLDAKSVPCRGD